MCDLGSCRLVQVVYKFFIHPGQCSQFEFFLVQLFPLVNAG